MVYRNCSNIEMLTRKVAGYMAQQPEDNVMHGILRRKDLHDNCSIGNISGRLDFRCDLEHALNLAGYVCFSHHDLFIGPTEISDGWVHNNRFENGCAWCHMYYRHIRGHEESLVMLERSTDFAIVPSDPSMEARIHHNESCNAYFYFVNDAADIIKRIGNLWKRPERFYSRVRRLGPIKLYSITPGYKSRFDIALEVRVRSVKGPASEVFRGALKERLRH